LEEATGGAAGSLAEALAYALGRTPSTHRSLLFPSSGAFAAAQAAEDWKQLVSAAEAANAVRTDWASSTPSGWLAAARRLDHILSAGEQLASAAAGEAPAKAITYKDVPMELRHKVSSVATGSDYSDMAVPANLRKISQSQKCGSRRWTQRHQRRRERYRKKCNAS
jgi:hypothetical protein